MKIVFLGIGTNLGNRESNLKEAVTRIGEHIGTILKSSSVYETEPWGFKAHDQFLNMVLKVETILTPSGVLGRILMIETLLGRVRCDKHYASRVIDIDILLFGDDVIEIESLSIPHSKLHERNFVLIPLCEIDPGIIHPVLGKTVAELLESCRDTGEVRKFAAPIPF